MASQNPLRLDVGVRSYRISLLLVSKEICYSPAVSEIGLLCVPVVDVSGAGWLQRRINLFHLCAHVTVFVFIMGMTLVRLGCFFLIF